MKKIILIMISAMAIITTLCLYTSAHPGRTDGSGGHHNSSTGEYHYHHGHPAHQHTNGECPYDFDDKTDHSGVSTQSKDIATKQAAKEDVTFWGVVRGIFSWIAASTFSSLALFTLFCGFIDTIKNEKIRKFCFITMLLLPFAIMAILFATKL